MGTIMGAQRKIKKKLVESKTANPHRRRYLIKNSSIKTVTGE